MKRPAVRLVPALVLLLAPAAGTALQAAAADDPRSHVVWEKDFDARCVEREGVMVLVRNTHPTRALKLRLERWHMGAPTGDRSRSLLKPGAEAERLGCSRTLNGPQEWRIHTVDFADPASE